MKAYPLPSISLEEAMKKQFKMVSCIMHHMEGTEQLSRGYLDQGPVRSVTLWRQLRKQVTGF